MRYTYLLALLAVTLVTGCAPDSTRVTELFPMQSGDKFGFMDRSGKMAIAAKYTEAGCFRDDIALVAERPDAWGYIDKTGKAVIPAQYVSATSFSEDVAFAVKNGEAPVAIDKTGKVKFTLTEAEQVDNFSEGLAAFSVVTETGERWGFTDKDGKVRIAPKYLAVGYFAENLCSAMNDQGKWGFIDKDNKTVVPFNYDNVSAFSGNAARVQTGDKWGTVDSKGKEIIAPQYENMETDGGAYVCQKDKKWGWIDRAGKQLIEAKYEDALPFNGSSYAAVRLGDKWGYIDKVGKVVIQPQFEFAFGFDGDMALAGQNMKYGFISKEGKMKVPAQYDQVSIDYIISYFSKSSAYNSVRTEISTPAHIAYRWLTAFYHNRYDEASKLSSDDTKKLLEQFSGLASYMTDSARQDMMKVRVGIKNTTVDGDKAVVVYTTSDLPGKEQLINLVRNGSLWQVQFTKNDIPADEMPAADEGHPMPPSP